MLKLKGGRLARELHDSCLQFWGGMGFTQENICSQVEGLKETKPKVQLKISQKSYHRVTGFLSYCSFLSAES